MNTTILICGQCMKPAERGRDAYYDEADRRDCACDAELIEVEARVDAYEAFAAHRVYIEYAWHGLIEACKRKRAEQRRGEHAYLYREDGLHWNEADRPARWAKIAERKRSGTDTATFSSLLKDIYTRPTTLDHFNRQAFGSGIITGMDAAARVSGLGLDVVADDRVPPGTAFVVPMNTTYGRPPWDDHDAHVQAHSDFWRQTARPEYREPPRAGKAIEALMERDTIRPEKARVILEGLV